MIRTQSTMPLRRRRARPTRDSFSNDCTASELAELSATIHGLRRSLSELERITFRAKNDFSGRRHLQERVCRRPISFSCVSSGVAVIHLRRARARSFFSELSVQQSELMVLSKADIGWNSFTHGTPSRAAIERKSNRQIFARKQSTATRAMPRCLTCT